MSMRNEEKALFSLRALYESYGYCRYKMSKFEEYDLYVLGRDSLISEGVITFTDTNGKLMALKPDVTLSIIKNNRGTQKVYYNENVYRVSKGTNSFKEIMQAGIERIGDIDDYAIFEVIMLAAKSLKTISDTAMLDISHLGIISQVISGLSADMQKEVLRCLTEKNIHELPHTFVTDTLKKLMSISGRPADVLPRLYDLLGENAALSQLEKITNALSDAGLSDVINIDFSVSGDIGYYNGLVFKGFIKGVPECVLSGGQYDFLMKKMGKDLQAIGFAVYLDSLSRLFDEGKKYDADIAIIYGDDTDISLLYNTVTLYTLKGKTVVAFKKLPSGYKCREIINIGGGQND
ncbi:MAG: ATP phosphoribosyltransferase regulatory subunit [Clostridia bacterium]|nr:ATP phosphoribosyltransferase regulatory subunit [Clostridia bacterium]